MFPEFDNQFQTVLLEKRSITRLLDVVEKIQCAHRVAQEILLTCHQNPVEST